ncbi:dystroglycan-like [Dorcoceras hygrometricum]|uniref:Dystroglycan-like n=1 Tax=Dorcoceras hygrometricum TaxID=472368 RepID=A0A2Z7BXD4_9LAMI|nr:dystroglycan-like [Dorcoceras hygrometricum]
MASSYYTNTLHVSFETVLAMDNPGMVSMFKALTASGLLGFLGCPAVIYEAALIDFFENALVWDGVVISTVAGKLVEISEELFAETFELPVKGLTNLSEIPMDLVFDVKSIVSLTGEPTEASPDEHPVKESMEAIEEKLISTDEAMSLEDILMSIPVEVRFPSTGVEFTKITLGKSIKSPGVDEMTWYMASLPQIPEDDKGKKPLMEKDPVKGNPVKEQFLLIVADIDLLVQLREQIIDEIAAAEVLSRLLVIKIDLLEKAVLTEKLGSEEVLIGTEVEVVLVEVRVEETGVNVQKEGDLVMSRRSVVLDMVHMHQLAYQKKR